MGKFLLFLLALATIGIGIAVLRRLRSPGELPALVAEEPAAA